MVERLGAGSWEVKFIEATAELLKQGWTVDSLVRLAENVADTELVFQDEPA